MADDISRRVPFTGQDRKRLAYYLAMRCPTRDGRKGNNVYKELERLVRAHATFVPLAHMVLGSEERHVLGVG